MLAYLQAIETPEARDRFEALYLAYRGLMYHVAYQVLQNSQDAEDAVHLSFVSLAEHTEMVPPELGPRAGMLAVTVAERKAIDLYRTKRRHQTVDTDEVPFLYSEGLPEETGTVAAMAALPPRYRQALLLRFCLGYSGEEAVALLGTTPETLRQLVSRAKKKLAAELTERVTIKNESACEIECQVMRPYTVGNGVQEFTRVRIPVGNGGQEFIRVRIPVGQTLERAFYCSLGASEFQQTLAVGLRTMKDAPSPKF